MANSRSKSWERPVRQVSRRVRPSQEEVPLHGTSPDKSREEVARTAYGLYEQRGRQDGCDQEDWFRAEEMIRQRSLQSRN